MIACSIRLLRAYYWAFLLFTNSNCLHILLDLSTLLREKTTNLDEDPEKSPTHRIVENYYSMY